MIVRIQTLDHVHHTQFPSLFLVFENSSASQHGRTEFFRVDSFVHPIEDDHRPNLDGKRGFKYKKGEEDLEGDLDREMICIQL